MLGFVVILVAYFFSAFVRVSPTIVMPIFQQSLGLGSSTVGLIGGIYFIPYGLMQIFAGALCQKYGVYRIGGLGQILSALGLVLFAYADNATMLFVGRLLVGIGMGPVFITVIVCLQKLFSGSMYATMFGFAVMISNIGSASAAAPLQFLLSKFGIQPVFLVVACVSSVLAVAMLLMDRNQERQSVKAGIFSDTIVAMGNIFRDYRLRCCFLCWLLHSIILNSYQGLWSTKWISVAFPAFAAYAGLGSTAVSLGVIFGCPSSEALHHRNKDGGKRILFTNAFTFVVIAMLICFKSFSAAGLFFVVSIAVDFVYGFACGDNSTQMAAFIRAETNATEAATYTGIFNGIGCFASQLFEWASGAFIGLWGIGATSSKPYALVYVFADVLMIAVIVYSFGIRNGGRGRRTLSC